MANTTWSTTDKWSGLTLSGGNLTVTYVSQGGIRASDKQTTGKFYWEVTVTAWAATSAVGVAPSYQGLTGTDTPAATTAYNVSLAQNGTINLDHVSTGITFGTVTNGTVVCIAADFTNGLIWFRLGAAGNWNNNASNNPATGVGGVALTHFTQGFSGYPYAFLTGAGNNVTANFGDTAFTGTVPSGFTSGFTAGTTSPLNAAVTQEALEEWTQNADARLTQIALEQWVNPATGNVQALLTQIALEEWCSVALRSSDTRAMIMA